MYRLSLPRHRLPYVTSTILHALLRDSPKPNGVIHTLVQNGTLIRLRRGFFLIADHPAAQPGSIPFEAIANLLYGPSYLSLEWILSLEGLIPERAVNPTSISVLPKRVIYTPIAAFIYYQLTSPVYPVGVRSREFPAGRALAASPEKALCDLVARQLRADNLEEMESLVTEFYRIEPSDLRQLSIDHLRQIADLYGDRNVTLLYQLLRR
ncbi:MAG: type IV toxin-antitoxin system AbiEi family antitoxin domain-containing protein [Chlamydiia bacterium]